MTDLGFLADFMIPVIVGICLCVGYVIKKWVKDVDNKYIPTVCAIILGMNCKNIVYRILVKRHKIDNCHAPLLICQYNQQFPIQIHSCQFRNLRYNRHDVCSMMEPLFLLVCTKHGYVR